MSEALRMRSPAVDLDEFERRLFAKAPAERANDDPLAELSRIVGKNDPFKGIFATPAPAPAVQPQTRDANAFGSLSTNVFAPKATPAPANQSVVPTPSLSFAAPPRQAPVPEPRVQNDDAFAPHYFDEAAVGPATTKEEADFFSYMAPSQTEEEAEPYYEEVEPAAAEIRKSSFRGRAILMSFLLIGAIGGAAAIGWTGRNKTTADGSLPLIKAAATPVKVEAPKAETEADKAAAAAATPDANAKIVSKTEQPVDVVQPAGQPPIKIARVIPMGGDQINAIASPAASTVDGAGAAAPGLPAARAVKTVSVRPDGTIIGAPAAKPAASTAVAPTSIAQLAADSAPIAPAPAAAAPSRLPLMASMGAPARTPAPAAATPTDTAPTPPARVTTPKATIRATAPAKPVEQPKQAANQPLQLSPLAGGAKPAKVAAKPAAVDPINQAANEPLPTATSAASSGTFAVQLAAPPTEAEAKATAAKLQSQFASELNGHRAVIRKADLGGGRTVYRVRVANLGRDEAVSLCESLKSSGGQCFISR